MGRVARLTRLGGVYRAFRSLEIEEPPMPVRLWVEPTNWCNLRCPYCPQSGDDPTARGYLSLDLFAKILDDAQGFVYDINLTHRGESLIHPEIDRLFAMCRERGIHSRMHTNATILNRERTDRILASQPEFISFSFDGYDKEVYEKNRVNGRYEKVIRNIENFLIRKQELGLERPYTVFQVIEMEEMLTPEQQRKGRAMERHLRDLGLDKFYRKRLHNWAGNVEVEEDVTWSQGMGRGYVPCTFPWYAMTVFWDGRVSPCPQDYFEEVILGDLRTQSLREIWTGEPMRKLRESMASRRFEDGHLCTSCDRLCQKAVAGVPVGNLKPFLTETLIGYDRLRDFVRR